MKAFLLIGQSNMAGRGDFGQVPEIKNPRCFMLRNGRWHPMSEPINPDRQIFGSFHSGVGLAASFADAFANHFVEDVGLIPCADGGTAISQWQPSEILYDHAVLQARLAARTSQIAGILWHQGENDSRCAEDARLYRQRFMNMIHCLKRDLRLPDDIPVILGELGEFASQYEGGALRYCTQINETLRQLSEELPCTGLAAAKGLCCKEDGIHFDSPSYRTFGLRYFEAYLKVVSK